MARMIRLTALLIAVLLPAAALAAPARYQLQVDGLACPFCAYGIEKELKATDGVAGIDIDINAGTVTVTMEEGAAMTEARAAQVVEDAGFTLGAFNEIEAAADAAAE